MFYYLFKFIRDRFNGSRHMNQNITDASIVHINPTFFLMVFCHALMPLALPKPFAKKLQLF